jgi:hypothetical protein
MSPTAKPSLDMPDLDAPAPVLLEIVGSVAVPIGQILVPYCGAGHDVFSMALPGSLVTGVDPRPDMPARFEALREDHGLPRSFARILTADPLTWPADRAFDLVWDAELLSRLPPAERSRWVERLADLVTRGGELWALLHPTPLPPTSGVRELRVVDPLEVDALLAGPFVQLALGPVPRSHPERQGREWLGRWRRR